jgi:hypothetical protein
MMVFEIASAGIGAVGGAVATVASSKVYTYVKTKIVTWAQTEAAKIVADAKKV